jgi:hypothetical protein
MNLKIDKKKYRYMAKIKGEREPKPFQYISQMELSKELEGNFDKHKVSLFF